METWLKAELRYSTMAHGARSAMTRLGLAMGREHLGLKAAVGLEWKTSTTAATNSAQRASGRGRCSCACFAYLRDGEALNPAQSAANWACPVALKYHLTVQVACPEMCTWCS